MKNSELLQASLLKVAADETKDLVSKVREGVGSWHSQDSEPKGLPEMGINTDTTSVEYPTKHQFDEGSGWRTITGTGPGPRL